MKRPMFSEKLSVSEFQKYYWYKTELQEICRKYHLPTYGTKYELTEYITRFLDGTPPNLIKPIRKNKRSGILASNITPHTKIIASGVSLNNETRKFFSNYYGVENFSFNKAMGIKMREIEANNDTEATIQDLIDVYERDSVDLTQNKEEKTYQWNNFVRDFRNDEISLSYTCPLKVAAILWGKVRDSDMPKIYNRKLVELYQEDIFPFLKKKR